MITAWPFSFAMIGSRRVHLPVGIVSIGREGQPKEERHEKEGQEEIKGNVTKCNARKVRLSPPAARKA
jgi:hypothetical protein